MSFRHKSLSLFFLLGVERQQSGIVLGWMGMDRGGSVRLAKQNRYLVVTRMRMNDWMMTRLVVVSY